MSDKNLNEITERLLQRQSKDDADIQQGIDDSNSFVNLENAWNGVISFKLEDYDLWEAAFRRLGEMLLRNLSYFWLEEIQLDAASEGLDDEEMAANLLLKAGDPKTNGEIADCLQKITRGIWFEQSCWKGLVAIKNELEGKEGVPPIKARSKSDLGIKLEGWNGHKAETVRRENWKKLEDFNPTSFRHENEEDHKSALNFLAGQLAQQET
jgi:hypothetical protein